MADLKISELTNLTAADPANDMIPIVDVSATPPASGSTKRISINNILACSPTATLASATISGDLTVDTSTLKVDSANNRVGVLNAAPNDTFTIASDNYLSFQTASTGFNSGRAARIGAISAGSGNGYLVFETYQGGSGGAERYRIASDGVATWSNVGGVAGTAMTLNSTGLGIGASPTQKLHVKGVVNFEQISGGTNVWQVYTYTDGTYRLNYNGSGSDELIIDTSGNVGIKVEPSAWNSNYNALDIGQNGTISGRVGTSNTVDIVSNGYRNSAGNWMYKLATSNTACRYQLDGSTGGHIWYSGAAGTAGNTIAGFSTATMTLDASGNLLVGVTTTGNRLDVQKSTDCTVLVKSTGANANVALDYVSTYGNHTIRKNGTAVWDFGVINDASATPAFKVSNASSVGVQLVSGATSWTTLSDETMKDIIEPISNAVSKVGSLRSVIGKFKTDDSSKRRSFLIAQDVQSVLPEAVDVIGENNELGLRYTEVIPLLVAAIKELTAEVNALKNA